MTADVGAEVEAFNAYAEWCKGQAYDDGHQQKTLYLHLPWSTSRRLQLYFTPRQHRKYLAPASVAYAAPVATATVGFGSLPVEPIVFR